MPSTSAANRRQHGHALSRLPRAEPFQRPWQACLGVASGVSAVNFAAFLLHCASSIVFLVFLNASQPFLIAQLGQAKRQGALSGTLIFFDEVTSMLLALVWGSLADVWGTRPVTVTGYCVIAVALYTYTLAQKAWPDLLYARLTFAVGGSAVTAMLTGILNAYAASASDRTRTRSRTADPLHPGESDALLDDDGHESVTQSGHRAKSQPHGRLAAMAGLSTGLGALFAVFFLLRLPTWIAGPPKGDDGGDRPGDGRVDKELQRATRVSFDIVALIALLIAVLLAFGLKGGTGTTPAAWRRANSNAGPVDDQDRLAEASATPREERRRRMKKRIAQRKRDGRQMYLRRLLHGTWFGFRLIRKDASLLLAYVGGALARASTIATTVFVPLLVTQFYYKSGKCHPHDADPLGLSSAISPASLPAHIPTPDELKRQCREAFTVAAILSGVIQLTTLVLAPLIGYLCDAYTPARVLLFISSIGALSYATLALALPNDGDPRGAVAMMAAVGIGVAQVGAIVASLVLCAKAKARHSSDINRRQAQASVSNVDEGDDEHPRQPRHDEDADDIDTPASGAIAGAYSATGGLSIVLVSTVGGWLSDRYAPSAFLLLAGLATLTAIVSGGVLLNNRVNSSSI